MDFYFTYKKSLPIFEFIEIKVFISPNSIYFGVQIVTIADRNQPPCP